MEETAAVVIQGVQPRLGALASQLRTARSELTDAQRVISSLRTGENGRDREIDKLRTEIGTMGDLQQQMQSNINCLERQMESDNVVKDQAVAENKRLRECMNFATDQKAFALQQASDSLGVQIKLTIEKDTLDLQVMDQQAKIRKLEDLVNHVVQMHEAFDAVRLLLQDPVAPDQAAGDDKQGSDEEQGGSKVAKRARSEQ